MGKGIFKLEIDKGSLDRMFSDLPNVTKRATANALNFTTRKVNKALREHLETTYHIPKEDTGKPGGLVSLKLANAHRSIGVATIFIRRKGRDLSEWGTKQTDKGLIVKVKARTELIKGGFIAPMWRKGSQKVAMSKGKGRRAGLITRVSKSGEPYKAAKRQVEWGPQIATLYTSKGAKKVMNKTIEKKFQKELDKQFNAQFEKRGR